jgi:hypothetical protein
MITQSKHQTVNQEEQNKPIPESQLNSIDKPFLVMAAIIRNSIQDRNNTTVQIIPFNQRSAQVSIMGIAPFLFAKVNNMK